MSLRQRNDSLSMAERADVDQLCLQFEDQWLAGRRPVIEHYLPRIQAGAREDLLRELLLIEIEYQRGQGGLPSEQEYVGRFPGSAVMIRGLVTRAMERDAVVRYLPGNRIGRYAVKSLLGTGAFANVYQAYDEQLQRDVAVKVASRSGESWTESDLARLLDEARAVARLQHPSIVSVYDSGQLDDGTFFLVMQFVDGRSLRDELADRLPDDSTVRRILAEVASALNAAHAAGVFHRDLKPSNILIDSQGHALVCDFGLALCEQDQRRRAGECAGTLAYMAPEQVEGKADQLDGRADIWALGVLAYEMLTGRRPFQGATSDRLADEILKRDPRPPRQIAQQIARDLDVVCLRCLQKRPADRYATADDVRAAVVRDGSSRSMPSSWWMVACGLLLLLLAGFAARGVVPDLAAVRRTVGTMPLQATLELYVWGAGTERRRALLLEDPGAVPLRPGDQVRLSVKLNQAAFCYLLWLDSRGDILPVYPWQKGSWTTHPPPRPVDHVDLPATANAGWVIERTPAGAETLLLLVRHSPLPDDIRVDTLLGDFPNDFDTTLTHPVRFEQGELTAYQPRHFRTPSNDRGPKENRRPKGNSGPRGDDSLRVPRDRGPRLVDATQIDDRLLQLHRMLADKLKAQFSLVQAVTFPVAP